MGDKNRSKSYQLVVLQDTITNIQIMSVAIEKSGTKPKIPPDDYIKSERSKRKKKSSMSSRDNHNKPNLQKENFLRNKCD